ncbi:MAG TPA: CPBP family intramembrane metalloprotease [Candidatus Fraserbacteria bacterium]|nr:CPBP family intramembrane metalloprotease [Candidatus Fraserbacteria bacterium]
MQSFVVGIGPILALLLTSILFGLGHSYEGGIMAILNASLLGAALGLTVLQTRSLWLAVGFHYGWNITASLSPTLIANPSSGLELSNPAFTVSLILLVVLLYVVKMGPNPQMESLWDRYIHPAPWPPWKRRAQPETESYAG